MLTLLANVNDKGVSINKGTLEVIVLILAIVVLLLFIFGRRWWHR